MCTEAVGRFSYSFRLYLRSNIADLVSRVEPLRYLKDRSRLLSRRTWHSFHMVFFLSLKTSSPKIHVAWQLHRRRRGREGWDFP